MTVDPAGIGTPPGPDVPFEGMRRHARALVAGLVLLLVIAFLVPDLAPPPSQPPPVELLRGRIVELIPDTSAGGKPGPDVRIVVLDGDLKGQTVEGFLQGPSGSQDLPRYQAGDEVIVNVSTDGGDQTITVNDLYRIPALALLLVLFAAAVTIVGGWRGVRSLIALALTLAVIVKIVVPLILAGYDPAWVAILAATGVTVVTLVLTEGVRRTTVAAIVGTFGSLALVAVLAVVFDELARFTTQRGSEDLTFLQAVGLTDIDIGGLILAAIIFGALGILDDVTVTQAATVGELHEADPRLGRVGLAKRSMNVGRSHIAATVNTLVLAYVGASLPLIVLFAAGRQDPMLIASSEVVAVEVVRAIVGSIGIVMAVPLTTAVAVALTDRSIPFFRRSEDEARRAHGWH